eukprot:8234999-Pyramimonas_sp.AAC.1
MTRRPSWLLGALLQAPHSRGNIEYDFGYQHSVLLATPLSATLDADQYLPEHHASVGLAGCYCDGDTNWNNDA